MTYPPPLFSRFYSPVIVKQRTLPTKGICLVHVEGYGLTETLCSGTANRWNNIKPGSVGTPGAGTEIKLRSCYDANGAPQVLDHNGKPYRDDDTQHLGEPCLGRGEIMIRGPAVAGVRSIRSSLKQKCKERWFMLLKTNG